MTATFPVPGTDDTPLTRLVDEYLMSCRARGLSPKTIDNYERPLRSVFLAWCSAEGVTDVPKLDRRAVDRLNESLLSRPARHGDRLSPNSVHSYLRPVRQLLTWASSEGEHVAAKPQLPKLPRLYKDALSANEMARMEAAVPNERDKLIIRLFADCGLRLNELRRLEPGDVMRSGRMAQLRIHGKGNRERRVPLPPALLRRLDRYVAARPTARRSDHIFLASRRDPLGYVSALGESGVKQLVCWAAKRAGISRTVHPHLLRHSWMTEMLRRGVNPAQLTVVAGTSPPVIARHYEHLTYDDAYDAMMRALVQDG